MTYAQRDARDILKHCKMPVLIGSSAVHNEPDNVGRDVDIAINYDDLIENYLHEVSHTNHSLVREEAPVRSDDGTFATYAFNGIISQCNYNKNDRTRWVGVEKISYPDGSSMDLLYYSKEDIVVVDTVMKMLLANPNIWEEHNKPIRVELYEKLIHTLCKR